MATESPIRILEGTDRWPTHKQTTRYGPSSAKMAIEGLGLFLKDQRFQGLEKDVVPSRSESAPPNMEGSIEAVENIFSQQKSAQNPCSIYPSISAVNCETELQLRADLYSSSSCHDTDAKLDQRLTGPLNSWKSCHIFQCSGSTANAKMTSATCANDSLHLHRNSNSLPAREEESEDDKSSEWSASVSMEKDALLGYRSLVSESTQEDSSHPSLPLYDHYRTSSNKSTEETVVSDDESRILHNISVNISSARINIPCSDDMREMSTAGAGDVHSAMEAVKTLNLVSSSNSGSHKLNKREQVIPQNNVLQQEAAPQVGNTSRVQGSYSQIIYPGIGHASGSSNQFHYGSSNVSTADVEPIFQSSGIAPPLYATAAALMTSANTFYPNLQPAGFFPPQYSMGGYNFNSAVSPSYLAGYSHQAAVPFAFDGPSFPTSGVSGGGHFHTYDLQNLLKFYGQVGVPWQFPFHMHYFQPPVRDSYGSYNHFDHQTPGDGSVVNHVNSRDSKKGVQLVGLSNNSKTQHVAGAGYNNLNLERGDISSNYYFGSQTNAGHFGLFPAASVSQAGQSKPVEGTNLPGGRYNISLSPSSSGNPSKTNGQSQSWNDMKPYSFLEELKSGKGQRFELSDIAGHIVEFSTDQHGSRFIQQKLEACSVEEKASVFKEVVPHASKLITDVFGNYVIQKLFEYGSLEQRKYLANQLEGQILPLSLQMYGCRVIQKALEVIDLEQKVRLVRELDGHIIRCVRDQNGNHVIQKCIESIPTDNIHFIISSFRGQVATLSMHPYGCRVIQRVLEHCNNDIQTQFIVDEILDSVCSLAQDQYGNYVTQHVLERGKPRERSEIIEKLAGSIVQLSQHKFASNVVEKCLEYSDSTARGMLIKEIIGHGDKDDNLLIMMKDQYANYVIQKILEKCSSDQREVLLGLIRSHLTALKKYTYGKHIVARFEQLYGDEMEA